jgi:hypothetical protein
MAKAKTVKGKHPGGAPRKVPEGLTEVLFLRVAKDTLEDLDAMAAEWAAESGGLRAARSDVARKILDDARKAWRARRGG